jgi:uncharacterized protein (DUF2147 family)
MAHTVYEDRDLNSSQELSEGLTRIKTDPEMVQLAAQLVQRQSGKYDSADLEDRYETRLRAMIDAKLKGEGVELSEPKEPDRTNVVDWNLMAAMRPSSHGAGSHWNPSRGRASWGAPPFCRGIQPDEKRLFRTQTGLLMQTRKWRRQILVCLLAILLLPMAGVGRAEASAVDGTWTIRDLVLHIFDCQLSVCGRIVWIKYVTRRTSQCGMTIIWGLEAKGPTDWEGGSILDPNNGKTYQLSAPYEPDGTLHARIFKGIPLLGNTEILKRVDVRELVGRC